MRDMAVSGISLADSVTSLETYLPAWPLQSQGAVFLNVTKLCRRWFTLEA